MLAIVQELHFQPAFKRKVNKNQLSILSLYEVNRWKRKYSKKKKKKSNLVHPKQNK